MPAVKASCLAYLLAVVLFTSPAIAQSAPSSQTIREECSAQGQASMRDCLSKKVAESARKLEDAEKQTLLKLSRWDEDAKYAAAAKSRLQAANKAFAQYRATHCAYVASLGGGAIGNALDIRRLACVYELNLQRALQIEESTHGLPIK